MKYSGVFLRLMLHRIFCWTKIGRVFSIKFLRTNVSAAVTGFLICFTLLWLGGLLDFVFEENFRHFKWPPFIDVRREVVRELMGEVSETPSHNDWRQLAPLVKPSCKNNRFTRRQFLLIIVKSAPDRFSRREAIRATYGNLVELNGFRLRTVFALGLPRDSRDTLYTESSQYGDLMIGNFIDHYQNNTLKFLNSIDLAQSYCDAERPVPYVFLVDDDYLVSPRNLISEAQRHTPNERLYVGWRFISSPFRCIFQKHRISLSDYPYSAYPPYVTGGAVLLTGQTAKEFYIATKYAQLFKFDDVYAGVLAYLLGINTLHNENFCFRCPSAANVTDEWWKWRTYIAMHGFSPELLVEKYRQIIEPTTAPIVNF